MAEGQDPREYRGGVHEPDEAKGEETWADNEGVVPREMLDEDEPGSDDPQALNDSSLGQVTDRADQDTPVSQQDQEGEAEEQQTGAAASETKEEMDKDQPVSWVQGANVAREDEEA